MKIAIAQLNYHIGNFDGNLQKMLKATAEAKSKGADLIVFGELATCGYPPRDFLEFRDFIRLADESIDQLREASVGIGIAVGSPTINPVVEGKDLHNSVFLLYNQEILHVQHKTLLPTYDVFDEYRYFEPANKHKTVMFKGKRIALTVCEDLWNVGNLNPLYKVCPMDMMMPEKPDLIINVSASPFDYNHAAERIEVLRENVKRYNIPLFYSNNIGAQTEIIFDGGSLIFSPDGQVYDEMPYFVEEIRYYQLEDVMKGGYRREQAKEKITLIHDAIILGLKDYFGKLGLKKAILGLSGGIDSAITTVMAVRALGKENVRVVLMPSPFSSSHSVEDAKALAENLGIRYDIIPIKDPYESFLKTLEGVLEGKPFDVTEENIQARCRAIILMAISNKHGNILLNTTNKSEFAVGYGTLYGDLAGGLSVLGDIYKTEIYLLADYINKDEKIIPENSINKPPSAELRPNQKDSDSLPEYHILDPILYMYIERRLGPQEIIDMGYDEALVRRILKLVNISEFKRHQTAPVLRVSPKAFGVGRRMPIVGKYLS
ncbi:MAG: NAD+ synthase [Saprospiraceae bacterium]|uniref:Glutamine-dependent NAD(+) synthetase n=1 Tax=Candidatus Opimibacter skivensis TaxID=2982028 RepID=A0A9D7SV41_9BACT|nr:NAD+ synthase [Candidatus Opimibacter skivensis]